MYEMFDNRLSIKLLTAYFFLTLIWLYMKIYFCIF